MWKMVSLRISDLIRTFMYKVIVTDLKLFKHCEIKNTKECTLTRGVLGGGGVSIPPERSRG